MIQTSGHLGLVVRRCRSSVISYMRKMLSAWITVNN